MNIIYKITNTTNNKSYIGQTARSLAERWSEHKKNAYSLNLNRPLYYAMRKYGIESFIIEVLEEVDNQTLLDEREQYWIRYYDTYGRGYNATLGGDGSYRLDYEKIILLYEKEQNASEVARQMNVSVEAVRDTLHRSGIQVKSAQEVGKSKGTLVDQLDKKTLVVIKTFNSAREAALEVVGSGGGAISHITDVCKRKRKSAYGYKWRFHEE